MYVCSGISAEVAFYPCPIAARLFFMPKLIAYATLTKKALTQLPLITS